MQDIVSTWGRAVHRSDAAGLASYAGYPLAELQKEIDVSDLLRKCLRCGQAMEEGRINLPTVAQELTWFRYEPLAPTGWNVLFGKRNEDKRAILKRLRESVTRIVAFKCLDCGYIEMVGRQSPLQQASASTA